MTLRLMTITDLVLSRGYVSTEESLTMDEDDVNVWAGWFFAASCAFPIYIFLSFVFGEGALPMIISCVFGFIFLLGYIAALDDLY